MKMFISIDKDGKEVHVNMRPEGDGIIGDFHEVIKKGQSLAGITFDEFIEHGSGEMIVDTKRL